MGMCGVECDQVDLKARRGACRFSNLSKKRALYSSIMENSRANSHSCVVRRFSSRLVKQAFASPHGAVRSTTRSCLAKGLVGLEADLPTINSGRVGRNGFCVRKPSVSPILGCWERTTPYLALAFENVVPTDKLEQLMVDGDTTTDGSDDGHCSNPYDLTEDSVVEHSDDERSDVVVGSSDDGNSSSPAEHIEELAVNSSDIAEIDQDQHAQAADDRRRIAVLHQLWAAERAAREKAETIASAAYADAENANNRAKETENAAAASLSPQQMRHHRALSTAPLPLKKQALQLERQQAAALRKKRNQAAQLDALRQKAKQALQEAEAVRDLAEAETLASKAELLAKASIEAQAEAEAYVQIEMIKAQANADLLMQSRLEDLAGAEALWRARHEEEAEARRVGMELEAVEAKKRMEHVISSQLKMQARLEAEAQAVKECAEQDALALKTRAVVEAVAIRRKAEEEMARSKAETRVQAVVAVKAERQAEVVSGKEGSKLIKQAKALEQQRSKAFKNQAAQKRKLEQQKQRELEAAHARAAEEKAHACEEAMAIRAEAFAFKHQLQEETREKARMHASAMCAAAEEDARIIRARAEAEALQKIAEVAAAQAVTLSLSTAVDTSDDLVGWDVVSYVTDAVGEMDGSDDVDNWAVLD